MTCIVTCYISIIAPLLFNETATGVRLCTRHVRSQGSRSQREAMTSRATAHVNDVLFTARTVIIIMHHCYLHIIALKWRIFDKT